jgi:hypothetical protein
MADGNLKPISDVMKGDSVYTGFPDDGVGLITAVLVHKVSKPEVRVGIISTPYGDLVGTPSHPIFFEGQWMELEDALAATNLSGSVEVRSVDFFYNLEVDGDIPGSSSHSYVVNGIIASGLGDNAELNTMYARQKVWKAEA